MIKNNYKKGVYIRYSIDGKYISKENMTELVSVLGNKNESVSDSNKISSSDSKTIDRNIVSNSLNNIMTNVITKVAQNNVVTIINGAVAANTISVSNSKIGLLNISDNNMENKASIQTELDIKKSKQENVIKNVQETIQNEIVDTASKDIFKDKHFDKSKSDRLNEIINMTNKNKVNLPPMKELGFSVFGIGNTTNIDKKKEYETKLKTALNLKEGIKDESKNEVKTSVKKENV